MSSTDKAHAGIGLRARHAMSGTNIAYDAFPEMMGGVEGYHPTLSFYASAMRCPVLTSLVLLPGWSMGGRDGRKTQGSCECLCICYAVSGTDIGHAIVISVIMPAEMLCATHMLCGVRYQNSAMCYTAARRVEF
eukprot:3831019-Rhodomonas_salina.1